VQIFRVLRVVVAIVLGLCFAGHACLAQKPPIDPPTLAAAKEMLVARGSDVHFARALDNILNNMAEARRKQTPGKVKDIDAIFAALRDKFAARKNDHLEWTALIYAEKFTTAELNEMIAFHKSPVGQKMLKSQTEITEQSVQFARAWGRKLGEEVNSEFRLELKKRGLDL
jgi:uncharacterized protein